MFEYVRACMHARVCACMHASLSKQYWVDLALCPLLEVFLGDKHLESETRTVKADSLF